MTGRRARNMPLLGWYKEGAENRKILKKDRKNLKAKRKRIERMVSVSRNESKQTMNPI